MRPQDGGAVLT